MKAHTKGPWRVGGKAIDADGIYIRATHDEADYALALVIRHDALPNKANAELIALAPTLLIERDALKADNAKLRAALQAMCNDYGLDETVMEGTFEQARTALNSTQPAP